MINKERNIKNIYMDKWEKGLKLHNKKQIKLLIQNVQRLLMEMEETKGQEN